MHDEACTHYED